MKRTTCWRLFTAPWSAPAFGALVVAVPWAGCESSDSVYGGGEARVELSGSVLSGTAIVPGLTAEEFGEGGIDHDERCADLRPRALEFYSIGGVSPFHPSTLIKPGEYFSVWACADAGELGGPPGSWFYVTASMGTDSGADAPDLVGSEVRGNAHLELHSAEGEWLASDGNGQAVALLSEHWAGEVSLTGVEIVSPELEDTLDVSIEWELDPDPIWDN